MTKFWWNQSANECFLKINFFHWLHWNVFLPPNLQDTDKFLSQDGSFHCSDTGTYLYNSIHAFQADMGCHIWNLNIEIEIWKLIILNVQSTLPSFLTCAGSGLMVTSTAYKQNVNNCLIHQNPNLPFLHLHISLQSCPYFPSGHFSSQIAPSHPAVHVHFPDSGSHEAPFIQGHFFEHSGPHVPGSQTKNWT